MSGTKVQHKETMITSIAWVPVGVPTENPRRAEVPDEDLDPAFVLAGGLEGESDRSDSDKRGIYRAQKEMMKRNSVTSEGPLTRARLKMREMLLEIIRGCGIYPRLLELWELVLMRPWPH